MVTHSALLARGHANRSAPQNAPREFIDQREQSVLLKYDGVMSRSDGAIVRLDGERVDVTPKIYFVVQDRDLAKMPDTLVKAAHLVRKDTKGNYYESEDSFFVKTGEGMNLYVDSDVHPSWYDELARTAKASGLKCYEQKSDLYLLSGEHGDVSPPTIAAYQANDFKRVPLVEALNALKALRSEVALGASVDQYRVTIDPFDLHQTQEADVGIPNDFDR